MTWIPFILPGAGKIREFLEKTEMENRVPHNAGISSLDEKILGLLEKDCALWSSVSFFSNL